MRGIQIKEYVKVSLLHQSLAHNSGISNINTQGPMDLKVTELPDPVPAKDQYVVGIHASATNFFDLLQIAGKYRQYSSLLEPSLSYSSIYLNTSQTFSMHSKIVLFRSAKTHKNQLLTPQPSQNTNHLSLGSPAQNSPALLSLSHLHPSPPPNTKSATGYSVPHKADMQPRLRLGRRY